MLDDSPIIVALDFSNAKAANLFLDRIQDQSFKLKVGLELFISEGPAFVENLVREGHQVFLDLKLHDIPNTIASACKVASNLGVWMMTLHASGGINMLASAQNAVSESMHPIKLVAVTVLTSLAQKQLKEIGIQNNANDHVLQLSEVALQANLDGIVCSVHEAKSVREKWGNAPLIVTPGIRMQKHCNDDQSRIATPLQARKSGSSFIVIGRPITQAADPILAIQQYFDDWESDNS